MEEDKINRCGWLSKDPLYLRYHDEEWGKPEYDSFRLFEMLCLGGQQAGLSWFTILKKREQYRQKFCNFNPLRIAKLADSDLKKIMTDPGIIRNRVKLESIINNARCYVQMENEGEEFSNFIWSFVNHKPIVNSWKNNKEIPPETTTSLKLSKALKKRDFKFVGATICYAFMQSCGLVNDHIESCFCKSEALK